MASLLVGVSVACRNPGVQCDFFRIFGGLLVVGPLIAGSWIVYNQMVGLADDSRSPRKRDVVLVRRAVALRHAWAIFLSLLGAGLVLSFAMSVSVGLLAVAASLTGLACSHPWIRSKGKLGLDSLVNGVCYGSIPGWVGHCSLNLPCRQWVQAFPSSSSLPRATCCWAS